MHVDRRLIDWQLRTMTMCQGRGTSTIDLMLQNQDECIIRGDKRQTETYREEIISVAALEILHAPASDGPSAHCPAKPPVRLLTQIRLVVQRRRPQAEALRYVWVE